ncbi:MAG: hypothetical protein IKU17_00120, partial [Clostridia bacterium]|nr:hypothetical protein [Clostridia bacterium]
LFGDKVNGFLKKIEPKETAFRSRDSEYFLARHGVVPRLKLNIKRMPAQEDPKPKKNPLSSPDRGFFFGGPSRT